MLDVSAGRAREGVPLSWATRHCANAIAHGASLDYLFSQALIEPRYGDDRDRISAAQLSLLYAVANLVTGDEARRNSRSGIPIGSGTLALRALIGCSTLEAGISAVIRIYELSSSTIKVGLTIEGEQATLIVHCDDDRVGAGAASLEDGYIGFFFMCISHFIGRPMPLTCVDTREPQHMNIGGLHWATLSPVRHASRSALWFPKSLLAARRVAAGSDQILWAMFEPWIRFVERRPDFDLDLSPSLAALRVVNVASVEGISASRFRRRIARDAGGFRSVRESSLLDAGLGLLLETADSVDSIAVQLGYSDARSFRRFIKTATGKTPHEWRAESTGLEVLRPNKLVHRQLKAVADQISLC